MSAMTQEHKRPVLIAAVSGGVDSVVMLHLLVENTRASGILMAPVSYKSHKSRTADLQLPTNVTRIVVAHVDHGTRPDSDADARFVSGLAKSYGLECELAELRLGSGVSEEQARIARHGFLDKIRRAHQAEKVATAHHRDDVVETATINLLRGTGRHGMCSLSSNTRYSRPLISWAKQDIYDYALHHHLEWVEDSTNYSDDYLRNRIRHQLLPSLTIGGSDKELLALINWFCSYNPEVDNLLEQLIRWLTESTLDHDAIDRRKFWQLSQLLRGHTIHYYLCSCGIGGVDQKLVSDLCNFISKASPGKSFNQAKGLRISQTGEWTLISAIDST